MTEHPENESKIDWGLLCGMVEPAEPKPVPVRCWCKCCGAEWYGTMLEHECRQEGEK